MHVHYVSMLLHNRQILTGYSTLIFKQSVFKGTAAFCTILRSHHIIYGYYLEQAKEKYDGSASCRILEPEDVARAVVYAASQPEYCAVNEILIEPREGSI